MTALFRRERTGDGSEVSTSLMSNGAWANGVFIQAALMDVEFPERSEPLPRHPFYDFYLTKDDREFALGMINSRVEWPKLIEVLGRPDWLERDLYEFTDPFANADILRAELSEEFSTRKLSEVDNLLRNSGVTYGILGRTTDHREDEQFIKSETLVPLEHNAFENLMTVSSPFLINEEKKIDFKRAPHVGEDTVEVLKGLGYSDKKIAELKSNQSIHFSS